MTHPSSLSPDEIEAMPVGNLTHIGGLASAGKMACVFLEDWMLNFRGIGFEEGKLCTGYYKSWRLSDLKPGFHQIIWTDSNGQRTRRCLVEVKAS